MKKKTTKRTAPKAAPQSRAPSRTADKSKAAKPAPKMQVSPMRIFAAEAERAELALKSSQTAKTLDGFDNFVSRLGLNNDNALSAGTYEFNLVTRNRIKLEAAYRGSWVVGSIIDSIAEDMTRAGVDVTTNESKADLKDLHNAISRLQIWQSICAGIKWGDLYGGAIGVIQIDGQDLSTPLDLDTIAKDQFQGLAIYDRWQLNPNLQDTIDSGPELGLPASYAIVTSSAATQSETSGQEQASGQIIVHHSRVIRFIGIELPFFQAQTEMFWGESRLERLWDRLISFDNATMSSAQLIDRANLRTVGVDGLREIIAAGGEAQAGLLAQFEMMRSLQVNEGLTLIDKEDSFASTAYSFAGLSDMMLQFGQQLAGASGIPLVRLFGQSPAGLNSSGEGELRTYYDNINAKQESRLRNPWEVLVKVLWRSVYGEGAPKDLELAFTPLWQTSELDKATIAKTNAESVVGTYDAGIINRETALKELRAVSSNTGLFSYISDEDIKESEGEEPPLPDAPEEASAAGEGEENAKESMSFGDSAPLSAMQKIKKWLLRN